MVDVPAFDLPVFVPKPKDEGDVVAPSKTYTFWSITVDGTGEEVSGDDPGRRAGMIASLVARKRTFRLEESGVVRRFSEGKEKINKGRPTLV